MIRFLAATNPLQALSSFQLLYAGAGSGSSPIRYSPFIYASLIKACGKVQAIREGKSIHCHVIRLGLDGNVNISNSLVVVYMGSVNTACYASAIFGSVKDKTVVTVNCMISGYVGRGNITMGFSLFARMLSYDFGRHVRPNFITLLVLISGCVEYRQCRSSLALHCCCCKIGLDCSTEVCNSLINFYVKYGCLSDATTLFRSMPQKDLISWNAMIWGYVNGFKFTKAFQLFQSMRIAGVEPDKVSLSCLLSVCAARNDLRTGEMLHTYAKLLSLECEDSIGTALIKMYAKCREVESARKLFNELPKENIELWNAMVHGYIENGQARDALKLLDEVKSRDLLLDEITMLGLIKACRDIKELNRCTPVHFLVESNDAFRGSLILKNALIDMYAKCGCMEKATSIFSAMPEKDVISWTSMIIGHAINGQGFPSLAMFHRMRENKIIPNPVTFVGVLLACDHTGMAVEGRIIYHMMQVMYGIKPQIEHYGCIIDMLARLGMIEEAEMFVLEMPMKPNAVIWRMLMNACRVHGQIKHAFKLVESMPELNASHDYENLVLSSNLFAEAGRWFGVAASRNLMAYSKAQKDTGRSSVLLTE